MRKPVLIGAVVLLMWTMPPFAVRVEAQAVAADLAPFCQSQESESPLAPALEPDEIARMSPMLRSQLLRVLQDSLNVWREAVEVVSTNLANSETTRTTEGKPYRRKKVVFQSARLCKGPGSSVVFVQAVHVVDDSTPFLKRFDPGHPDASKEGYVDYPNLDLTKEMETLMAVSRGYEASVAAINILKILTPHSDQGN